MPALLKRLPDDALLIWDHGFFGYSLWKQAVSRGVAILARVPHNTILKPIRHLNDGSFLAKIYPSAKARRHDTDGIVVRVIRYTLDDPQRSGHELVFDEQKTHHDPRRATKPAQLRSETPAGVIQEVYALSLGHFVVRAFLCAAAESVDLDPDDLSFTGCFHTLLCRLPECDAHTPQSFQQWYEALLWELTQERTDPRP